MQNIQPNIQRRFISDVLCEMKSSTEKIRIMGICVEIGDVSLGDGDTKTIWKNIVLDDGTSLLDVLIEKTIRAPDIKCGQNLDVVGSMTTIHLKDTSTTSNESVINPCILADFISINKNPNADTLRFLEVIRSKETNEPSLLTLQSGLYMAEHILKLVTPFRVVKDHNSDNCKLTIDRSRAYNLLKCSDRQGLSETQLASLLGCYRPQQLQALNQLLRDMLDAFEIGQTETGSYICL